MTEDEAKALVGDFRRNYPALAAEWDNAVAMAALHVYISDEPPVLLIDDKRRCMNCQCAFDAEFIWHHTREYWIERPDYCPQCETYRSAAIAGLFSGIAEWAKGHMTLDIESFGTADFAKGGYIDFEKASPTGRRLAPFVSPIDRSEFSMPKGRLSYPFVTPRQETRVQIVHVDFAEIEQRVAAMLGAKGVILAEIAAKCGIDLAAPLRREPEPYDFAAMIERHEKRSDEQRKKRPPAYLKHDPTKRNRGRRRR